MDSEQKTIPFDALVSDHSLCDAWKARQLERIADSLETLTFLFENAFSGGFLNVNRKDWSE